MLSCVMCPKTFSARFKLNKHMRTHTKEKPYKCPTCSATFQESYSLKKHIQAGHDGVKRRIPATKRNTTCPTCRHKCKTRGNLEAHMRKHSVEKPFSCKEPGCGFKTKYNSCIYQHLRAVHLQERPHKCSSPGCDYKTSTARFLKRHLTVHSNEKPFSCKFTGCKYVCKTQRYLNVHTSRVHSDVKPFKCSLCDFRTKYKSRIREHEDEHKNVKRFYCQAPNCSFATNSRNHLELHVGRKHLNHEVECASPGCNFKCGNNLVLRDHVRRNHLLPILKCPGDSCVYSTRSPIRLRLHVSRKHKDLQLIAGLSSSLTDGRDTLVCSFPNCEYFTEFRHRYDRHIKTHDKKKRKHICKFCSHRFSTCGKLQRHVYIHTGEKPYRCAHCDYAALDGAELRAHAGRIHNIHVLPGGQENEYEKECNTCNITLSSYSEFVLHSITHLQPVVVLERLSLHVL